MAPATLVLDASVAVKWFSTANEQELEKALSIRDGHKTGRWVLLVPDILFHEVANALVHKSILPLEKVLEALSTLWDLDLRIIPVSRELLHSAVELARTADITEYDAFYVIAASKNQCPLVTANPKHQGQELGCQVIPIREWKEL